MNREELLAEKDNEINLLKYMYLIYQGKITILIITILTIALGVALVMLLPKQFESNLTLVPNNTNEQNSMLSGLGGLASSFGLGGKMSTNENEMYEDFLKSRTFSEKLSQLNFDIAEEPGVHSLHVLLKYEIEESDTLYELKKINAINNHMKENFKVEIQENGIIKMTTSSPYPELSAQLLNTISKLFDSFYRDYQIKKAQEVSVFVEKRATDLEEKLKQSEVALKDFREKNRSVMQSPELLLQQERLEREIKMNTQLYIAVKTELEMARINEQKVIPILKVLDPAIPVLKPSFPNTKLILTATVPLGLALSVILVLFREYYQKLKIDVGTIFSKN